MVSPATTAPGFPTLHVGIAGYMRGPPGDFINEGNIYMRL